MCRGSVDTLESPHLTVCRAPWELPVCPPPSAAACRAHLPPAGREQERPKGAALGGGCRCGRTGRRAPLRLLPSTTTTTTTTTPPPPPTLADPHSLGERLKRPRAGVEVERLTDTPTPTRPPADVRPRSER